MTHIFIRSGRESVRIELDDIQYIESMQNYIRIHLVRNRTVMSLMTLKKIIALLPVERFIRIHRRYVVAIAAVRRVGTKTVRLPNIELPSCGNYYKQLKNLIHDKQTQLAFLDSNR
jgi:DNA-binding LytR/AlgR family response regulator